MDGSRFDRLAKALAAGESRRALLARLAAGALAAATASRAGGAAASCGGLGTVCRADAECCTGFCHPDIPSRPRGVCDDPPGCTRIGLCASDAECCPGLECAPLFASEPPRCGRPGPGRPCATFGTPCRTGLTCCGGTCVDTRTDHANCGGCGVVCRAGATEEPPICVAGECLPGACLPGAHKCPDPHEPHAHFVCCTTGSCCILGGCCGTDCPC